MYVHPTTVHNEVWKSNKMYNYVPAVMNRSCVTFREKKYYKYPKIEIKKIEEKFK